MMHNFIRNIEPIPPLFESQFFIIILIEQCCSSIADLGFHVSPSAISWLVVAVVINAINSCSYWSFSHIHKEVFKNTPSFANLNPPISVVNIIFIRWIVASLSHCNPCVVCCRPGKVMSRIFTLISFASTRFCTAIPKICAIAYNNLSAVTNCLPQGAASLATPGNLFDRQAAKFSSSKINELHSCNSIGSRKYRQQERNRKCLALQN